MKKFENVFEQAREIIRQQWALQDLRRKAECPGHPAEVQWIMPPRPPPPPPPRPPRLPAHRLTRPGYSGRAAPVQSSPAPPHRQSAGHENQNETRKGVFAI